MRNRAGTSTTSSRRTSTRSRSACRRETPGGWPAYAERLCSDADRADVEAFWRDRIASYAGGARTLAKTLESIELCTRLRAAQGGGVRRTCALLTVARFERSAWTAIVSSTTPGNVLDDLQHVAERRVVAAAGPFEQHGLGAGDRAARVAQARERELAIRLALRARADCIADDEDLVVRAPRARAPSA